MTTENELDARLARGDRAVRLGSHDASMVSMLTAAEAKSRTVSRRRALVRAGIGAALVVGLGLTAPAASAAIREFLSQTGQHCSGTECGVGASAAESEWIDSSKDDFADYVDSVFPADLPLPDGSSREEIVAALVDSYAAQNAIDGGGGWSTGLGLESSLESIIYCGWVNDWLLADDRGDAAARDRAAEVMREAATWSGIVKTDGGFVVDSMLQIADGADNGDTGTVKSAASLWACSTWETE